MSKLRVRASCDIQQDGVATARLALSCVKWRSTPACYYVTSLTEPICTSPHTSPRQHRHRVSYWPSDVALASGDLSLCACGSAL